MIKKEMNVISTLPKWAIMDSFIEQGIACFVIKRSSEYTNDRAEASFGEPGFYQYNGYCILPPGHPDRGVITKEYYLFLKRYLERPERIVYYIAGKPRDYAVHGCITYRDWGYGTQKEAYISSQHWVIGFDTGHYGDFDDIVGYKKGEHYVKYETQKLASQIRAHMAEKVRNPI